MTKSVLILGATSAIAEATARLFAAEGARLMLVGRRPEHLSIMAADLRLRGAASVDTAVLDLVEAGPGAKLDAWTQQLGGTIDHVIIAHGYLGDQMAASSDPAEAGRIIAVNFTSAAHWMLAAATQLRRQGRGTLVVLGSVAGDRGRRGNFVYGAAKAAIATLAEGLAHEFAEAGPRAVVVKIGPTDTPMTAAFDRKGPLWSTPEKVAAIIRRAADGRKPVVYAPSFWRCIMLIIRLIPARLFNRMSI